MTETPSTSEPVSQPADENADAPATELVPEPPIEMVAGEDVHEHVGRLVAFHRGRLYEVLGTRPVDADSGERSVLVPAPRFNLLGQPNSPGETMIIKVFADFEYPVSDSPTDPEVREELIRQGHHLWLTHLTPATIEERRRVPGVFILDPVITPLDQARAERSDET